MLSRTRAIGIRAILLVLSLACFWSCQAVEEDPDPVVYVSVRVDDSLRTFDRVRIVLLAPEPSEDTLDVLWDGPLEDTAAVRRIRAEKYRGGEARLVITAYDDGEVAYLTVTRFRGPDKPIEIDTVAVDDRNPPELILLDSVNPGSEIVTLDGNPLPLLAVCLDRKDGRFAPDTLPPAPPRGEEGRFLLRLVCRDRSGNSSPPDSIRLEFRLPPDIAPPVLRLVGGDTVEAVAGRPYRDSGALCEDAKDGSRKVAGDSVYIFAEGVHRVDFACADRAGNRAEPRFRVVRVLPAPDLAAPALTLTGADSLDLRRGSRFEDPGAVCVDAKDGILAAGREGEVDEGKPGRYVLAYRCADRAGNAAAPVFRRVRVVEPPDATPPVVRLLGPDSVRLRRGEAWSDSGAVCEDDRDGAIPVGTDGAVKVDSVGRYVIAYFCRDAAGNQASTRLRVVRVAEPPDTLAPALTLLGDDSTTLLQGLPWRDPGAACADDRDGTLPVAREGTVDSAVPGPHVLTYRCRDAAGNAAAPRVRKVVVVRPPDAVAPVLRLKGPDSLDHVKGAAFADPGAECLDDRDGPLEPEARGTVDAGTPGRYVLSYGCRDAAGNEAAPGIRVVRVVLPPDREAPVLALQGADSLAIAFRASWTDPGATCLDARDGALQVERTGSVDAASPGMYVLSYGCRDNAGNPALPKTRKVKVDAPPDLVPPVLTLLGRDSLDHDFGNTYTDAGAICVDDKDGERPVTRAGTVDVTVLGRNELIFSCRDAAGNQAASRKRVVRVVRYEFIDAHKEAAIDTTRGASGYQANAGCMSLLTFATLNPPYTHSFPLAFELDGVDRARLKSAKATFQTYISGPARPFSDLKVTFRIYRIRSAWEEGDGSWYFRYGQWHDGGDAFFVNHKPGDAVWARAKDPWYGGGITGENGRGLVSLSNMDPAGMDTVRLSYPATSFSQGRPGAVPLREHLVQVVIDLTQYVMGTAPGQDHGLVILVDSMPEDIHINWATKELGDGTLGPRLRLTY